MGTNHCGLLAAILAAVSVSLTPLGAEPPKTDYAHYKVEGETVEGLYRSMLSRGPKVGGNQAYASTKMDMAVATKTNPVAGRCRVDVIKLRMTFTIKLPELDERARISADIRQNFQRFYEFARHHEETHRAIWMQCAAEAQTLARRATGDDCAAAEARALAIVDQVGKQCDARHAAFDSGEQVKLLKHPFVGLALRMPEKPKNVVALPAGPPKTTSRAH